ncbi:TetR/AcrR family transcriptional regulator [Streptomyces sp. P6-2-1]|uniref:TetR/AcrR family transcriptional regulator n=1 Tax=unclassified Streptomyces TaxID=2593676 RepID=UPI003D3658ED
MPSTPPAPHGRTGRPPVTSRAQILAAARLLIDRDGWERLTIRRLAAELGIGATTLYHHIRNKEDLLVLLLNDYVERLPRPELPAEPRERVVAAASAMHDALAGWPWAAEVLTVDGFVGRLDSSALWMVEGILSGAGDHGCAPERTVEIFRAIWYYTVGEILVRARSRDAREPAATDPGTPDTGTPDPDTPDTGTPGPGRSTAPPAFDRLDASQVPRLAALGERWITVAARDTYRQGLRALVDGLLGQGTAEEST